MSEGIPPNRIVELINQKVDHGSAPEDYYDMVRKMTISDDGKEDQSFFFQIAAWSRLLPARNK